MKHERRIQTNKQANKSLSYLDALKILTPREIEIIDLVEKGYLDKEISGMLNLSVRTVHAHKRSIHEKIGISGKRALIKWLWIAKNGDSSGNS